MAQAKPRVVMRRPPPTPAKAPVPEDVAARFLAGAPDGPGHPEPSPAIPPRAPRAAAGSATLRTLKGGRVVRRMQVYFTPETAEALEAFAADQRRELSGIVEAAVQLYLMRQER